MLKMPRDVDRKARGVGTQMENAEENLTRASLVGAQCAGRFEGASNMACTGSIVDFRIIAYKSNQAH